MNIRIANRMMLIKIHTQKIQEEVTIGMSARIPHSIDFIIFLDYDYIDDGRLKDELMCLQDRYRLGDFYVFATREYGRHAVCIDRLPFRHALRVIANASACDYYFKKGPLLNKFRSWTLRVAEKGDRPKPEFLYIIESLYNGKRIQSQAHGEFLQRYYGCQVRLTNPDGNEELEIQVYETSSKTSLKKMLFGRSNRIQAGI